MIFVFNFNWIQLDEDNSYAFFVFCVLILWSADFVYNQLLEVLKIKVAVLNIIKTQPLTPPIANAVKFNEMS